jgi:hypothetical protein
MERPTRTLKTYTRTKTQNPIVMIQDLVQWTKWISSVGKAGEIKDWKDNKRKMVDFLNDLKDDTETLTLSESKGPLSPEEFYTMLVIQLSRLKDTLNQLVKLNVIHRNDFLYLLSIVEGIMDDNRDIVRKLEEEEILEIMD